MDGIFPLETLKWALGLVIGFPAAIVILGEAVLRLKQRRSPLATTLAILRNLLLPTAAVLVLLRQIVGLTDGDTSVRVVETVLWIFVLHTALSFVNDTVFAGAIEGSWQSRVPKLLVDLTRLILVLIGTGIVLSAVWRLDLGSMATAFGVGSIVIGLALQEPLGNVFSGVMLMFERPFAVGDWIRLDGSLGKVCEINWRAIHLETDTQELVIVPNAVLSKGTFVNLSRPTKNHTEEVLLGFSQRDAPNKVKQVLKETAMGTEGVSTVFVPEVETLEYKDGAIRYKVSLVVDVERRDQIRDEFQTRVWYSARRQGLTLASPVLTSIRLTSSDLEDNRSTDPAELLHPFPLFRMLKTEHEAEIAAKVIVRHFGRGERVVAEGEPLQGLSLILHGRAAISVRDRSGVEQEISQVSRGEYFGEGSLLAGAASDTAVTALEDLEVLVLDPEALHVMLDRSPHLAREIGAIMDQRRKAAQLLRRKSV